MLVPYIPPCSRCVHQRYDPDALTHPDDEATGGVGRVTCPRFPVRLPPEIFYDQEAQPCFEPRPLTIHDIEPGLVRILERQFPNVIPLVWPVKP